MSNTADVVIVGGGIIGCSIAYYLAKKGKSIIVLEEVIILEMGGLPEMVEVYVSQEEIQGNYHL